MPEFPPDDCFLPATDLAARIREQKIKPSEVVDALAKQIGKHDGKLNAFIYNDLQGARAEAAMKEKMLQQHPEMEVGPLYGVPIAIKDDLDAAGFPTTMGSRAIPPDRAARDDVTVARLKAAGAIVIGKTHEPEFGHKGVTNNLMGANGARLETATPWDATKTAGGSSGGSAAAVAAGMAYLAMGTDIAGSVRTPAACCGVVGLKPTFGMIPRVPSGNAFSLWVSGPIGRTAADVALAMSVLAGADQRDRFSLARVPPDTWDVSKKPARPRVLWCPTPTGCPVDDEVAKLCLDAVRALAKDTGGTLTEQEKPLSPKGEALHLLEQLLVLFAAGSLAEFLEYTPYKTRRAFNKVRDRLSPSYANFVGPAWDTTLHEYAAAQAAVTKFCETRGAATFAEHDIVATPTIPVPPFDKTLDRGPNQLGGVPIDDHLEWHQTWPYNLTGDPAVSVPCGLTRKGLPVGLQLAARRGQDGLVLRAAAVVEAAVGWRKERPKL